MPVTSIHPSLGDALIPIIGGAIGTLIGFRKMGKPRGKDATYDEKMRPLERPLKIFGLIVLFFGLIQLIRAVIG